MKIVFLIFIFSLKSWALEIPINKFDQSKLEFLLRGIPSANISSYSTGSFVKKSTLYPNTKSNWSIKCEADYYDLSPVPSDKSCKVIIADKTDFHGDEYLFKINGSFATEMYNALSYGLESKRALSHERVYGQAHEGNYRNLFRFMITCKVTTCELRFTPKEAY